MRVCWLAKNTSMALHLNPTLHTLPNLGADMDEKDPEVLESLAERLAECRTSSLKDLDGPHAGGPRKGRSIIVFNRQVACVR